MSRTAETTEELLTAVRLAEELSVRDLALRRQAAMLLARVAPTVELECVFGSGSMVPAHAYAEYEQVCEYRRVRAPRSLMTIPDAPEVGYVMGVPFADAEDHALRHDQLERALAGWSPEAVAEALHPSLPANVLAVAEARMGRLQRVGEACAQALGRGVVRVDDSEKRVSSTRPLFEDEQSLVVDPRERLTCRDLAEVIQAYASVGEVFTVRAAGPRGFERAAALLEALTPFGVVAEMFEPNVGQHLFRPDSLKTFVGPVLPEMFQNYIGPVRAVIDV